MNTGRAGDTRASGAFAFVRLRSPSTINMIATVNSIDRPSRTLNAILKRMIALPTIRIVRVWPKPHRAPIRAALDRDRSLLTIVVTAIT
jgi:hypothetical protein